MDVLAFGLGVLLLALVFWDVFETIVVPRPTPGWFRIARYIVRGSWRVVRAMATGGGRLSPAGDRLLGLFAPAATIVFLVTWLVLAILGYGLILFALRDQLLPRPDDLGSVLYFAASSVLTLGFGDVVAVGGPARFVVAASAVTGLGIVALVVTFLFALFGSYQRREVPVVLLQAKAGTPASAVVLLEAMALIELVDRLPDSFIEWSRWAAEVLDSHVAYPLLGYFRSSHDNLSWITALGTELDTANLVSTTILDVPRGEAKLFMAIGTHLVEDITNLGFRLGTYVGVDRTGFDQVYARLERVGYRLAPADEAWPAFAAARAEYAERLDAMATYWVVPAASWFGASEPHRSPNHRSAELEPATVDE